MKVTDKNILKILNIPDNSVISENKINYDGMIILGNYVESVFGFNVADFVAGESVTVEGNVFCSNDFRTDVWCRFKKDVTSKGDAFIGEFTAIDGKLTIYGDLDIGKEVKLNGGFEAKGWLVVRNPLPVIMFLFFYIRALIGIGKTSEEIEKAIEELFEEDEENITINSDSNVLKDVFVVPQGSKVTEDTIIVPDDAKVGKDVICNSSIYCKSFSAEPRLRLYGNIQAKESVSLSEDTYISGFVKCNNKLEIPKNCVIDGDITAKSVEIDESSAVNGKILAREGVVFTKTKEVKKTESKKTEKIEAEKTKSEGIKTERKNKMTYSKNKLRYKKRDKTRFRKKRKYVRNKRKVNKDIKDIEKSIK